jgi:hypothetical protein
MVMKFGRYLSITVNKAIWILSMTLQERKASIFTQGEITGCSRVGYCVSVFFTVYS